MKKTRRVVREFILPFVFTQLLVSGCLAGWVYVWVHT